MIRSTSFLTTVLHFPGPSVKSLPGNDGLKVSHQWHSVVDNEIDE